MPGRFPHPCAEGLRWDADVVRRLLRLALLIAQPAPIGADLVLADDEALDSIAEIPGP